MLLKIIFTIIFFLILIGLASYIWRYKILTTKQFIIYWLIAIVLSLGGNVLFQKWVQDRYWGNGKDIIGTVGYVNQAKYEIIKQILENDVNSIIASKNYEQINHIFAYSKLKYLYVEIWNNELLIYQNNTNSYIDPKKLLFEEDILLKNNNIIKIAFIPRRSLMNVLIPKELTIRYIYSDKYDFVLMPFLFITACIFTIITLIAVALFIYEEEKI